MPDIREEFEAWFVNTIDNKRLGPFAIRKDSQGNYFYEGADKAWKAWQASRAALRVELPKKLVGALGVDGHQQYADGWNDNRERVTEALQKAGIEVSP